ncbi:ABC transporter permease [Thermophagus sp. OGC60D27]|uniref:ABC transporter permease n=1 Tax=Thermophagus sp. OGC60D27 TaxID=3458415 RepID=UPI0040376DFE
MENYDLIIRPKRHAFDINFRELWQYRDLLYMFVKRDVITVYKQTILGPIWFVVQPILTTAIYILVFGNIAKISTDGVPGTLFYLAGIVLWNYFAESFNTTSKTFKDNADIFGKVYFPRLIMPLAKVTAGLIKFGIQFAFFMAVYAYYLISGEATIQPNIYILLLPLLILLMAMFGLGAGLIFTSLTTKYRDLTFLLQFGVQLLMYATPVIYPLSTIPDGKMKTLIMANPITPLMESFKYAFLGAGQFSWTSLAYSVAFAVVLLTAGMVVFHKTERNFIDTV